MYTYCCCFYLQLLERQIDGQAFVELTRADFSIIFPSNEKFLLGSRLYKIAKNARNASERTCVDTNEMLDELSDITGVNSSQASFMGVPSSSDSIPLSDSTPSYSQASTPLSVSRASTSSRASTGTRRSFSRLEVEPSGKRQRMDESEAKFKLPVFCPDIKKCIQNDTFYTSTQRNRLIKEACLALRGYYWEKGKSIPTSEKKDLATSLYKLAPKSLGDAGNDSKPEVKHFYLMLCCFYDLFINQCRLVYMTRSLDGFKTIIQSHLI